MNWNNLVEEAAVHWGLNPEETGIAKKIVLAESGGRPEAVSPKGAQGLMQLMPATAAEMGVKNPFDPRENIFGGVGYFKKMLDRFGGNIPLALAAYNAGPEKVQKAGGIPAIRETQDYVAKVLGWGWKVAEHVWGLVSPKEAYAEELPDVADSYMVRRQAAEENQLLDLLLSSGKKPGEKEDYDYKSAIEAWLKPDETGHWPSRIPTGPNEGLILKSENHPTFSLTLEAEREAGNVLYRHRGTGRLYSFPKSKTVGPEFKSYAEEATEEAEKIEKGPTGAIPDPDLDIVNIIGAFFGTAAASGIKSAAMGILGNVVGELLGSGAKAGVEEIAPRWGWVAGLGVDIASGMATDKAVERAVGRIQRLAPNITKETAQNIAKRVAKSPQVEEVVEKAKTLEPEKVKEIQAATNEILEKSGPIVEKPSAAPPKEALKEGEAASSAVPPREGEGIPPKEGEAAPVKGITAQPEAGKSIDLSALGDETKPAFEIVPYPKAKAISFAKQQTFADMPEDLPIGKYAININLNRIESGEEIKDTISKMAVLEKRNIDEARRGIIAQKETEKLADMLDMTPEKLLARRVGQTFNAEEALAARRLLVASASQVKELAEKAISVNASDVDLLAFRRAMTVMAAIQQQVAGMTAEAGRALASFRILAKETGLATRAIREWLETAGGHEETRRMAEKMAALDNPAQISKVVKKAWKATKFDVFLEAWINGLISNPVTHVVNFLSNMATNLVQLPERALAARIGKHLFREQNIASGEASAQLYGAVTGFMDGLQLAGKVLKEGMPSGEFATKLEIRPRAISSEALEISGVPGRAVDLMGEIITGPGKALTASDELWKSVGYRMELNAQALRMAMREGLEGEALGRRIQEILANPPESIRLAAINAANYQTFTQNAGPLAARLMAAAKDTPVLRLVLPFIRTPANIMKFTFERTPMAPLMRSVREDLMAGGARRDLALARISLGSMAMAVAGALNAAGILTGGGPSDPKLREALRRTGWQPYSVKIGDTYYSYQRLEPLGTLLGMGATFAEIAGQAGEVELDELASGLAAAAGEVLISKTWLTGLANLIEAIKDPERYGRSYLQKFAGTLIPFTGLVGQIERIDDPALRQTRAGREAAFVGLQSIINEIKSRIPGYSNNLPPIRNLWGEPIVLGGGLGPDMISPIYTSAEKESPIDKEIIRLKMGLSMPSRQINGVELTAQEYGRYVCLAGNELKVNGLGCKDALNNLVTSSKYQNKSDEAKENAIRQTIGAYREAARNEVIKEHPELNYLIRQKKQEGTR